jgi:hypothetical protein
VPATTHVEWRRGAGARLLTLLGAEALDEEEVVNEGADILI